jgi:hypothetical protein
MAAVADVTKTSAPDGTTALVPTIDHEREPVFVLLAKRTYHVRPNAVPVPAEKPVPLAHVDRYYEGGDPEITTVQFESEVAPFKLATDFVVIGSAFAPGGKPVTQLDAIVEVGRTKKMVRVFGDRSCEYVQGRSPRFLDPQPFTEIEIRYERAYGGTDTKSKPEMMVLYPRNPMGTGFVLANRESTINGLMLPNLEDPADLLIPDRLVVGEPEKWPAQPLPQGFGWFPKIAYPRCSFVGALPAFVAPGVPLKEETLGLVPRNQIALGRQFRLPSYDVRFNHGASLGLTVPFLAGGEPVRLTHLMPEGVLAFSLPKEKPQMMLDLGVGPTELSPVLHTACVRVADRQLDMIWRGALRYPGVDWLPEMKQLVREVVWP